MVSKALHDFNDRLSEVEQLLEAHSALTRFRRAERAAKKVNNQSLKAILAVVQNLVEGPKAGRPAEVHALNSAAIALLSAHLQGFVVDLFKEVATRMLRNVVPDVDQVIAVANTRGNPNEQNMVKLFRAVGFSDVLEGLSWQRMSNKQLRTKLQTFNKLRNAVVHGSSQHVKKSAVTNYLKVFKNFAVHLDKKLMPQRRRKLI